MILLLLAVLVTQSPAPAPFDLIEQATRLACSMSDDACLEQEFALRRSADQGTRKASAADLGCPDGDLSCLAAAWNRVDDDNLARLRAIVDARGWPALEGEAARGAWLIAQHADPSPGGADRAFRDLVLPMVLVEVRFSRLRPEDYARMIDRNALADGARQPFGTNRPCLDGRFDRTSIESVAEVDRRRREIGMDIMLWEALPLLDDMCRRDALTRASPIPAMPDGASAG